MSELKEKINDIIARTVLSNENGKYYVSIIDHEDKHTIDSHLVLSSDAIIDVLIDELPLTIPEQAMLILLESKEKHND